MVYGLLTHIMSALTYPLQTVSSWFQDSDVETQQQLQSQQESLHPIQPSITPTTSTSPLKRESQQGSLEIAESVGKFACMGVGVGLDVESEANLFSLDSPRISERSDEGTSFFKKQGDIHRYTSPLSPCIIAHPASSLTLHCHTSPYIDIHHPTLPYIVINTFQ